MSGGRQLSRAELVEVWQRAIEEEDGSLAGWCARLCEGLRGAEAFAESGGLNAFVGVAMGALNPGDETDQLKAALMQSLCADLSEFKVAVFETLAAAARWPPLRGRVAGSGVDGVVTAVLLAPHVVGPDKGKPRHPAPTRALMARLLSTIACDAPEVARLGDEKRAKEFARLRRNLIKTGTFKAFSKMLEPGADEGIAATAAARAVSILAGEVGDEESRAALAEAGVIDELIKWLPPDPDEGAAGDGDAPGLAGQDAASPDLGGGGGAASSSAAIVAEDGKSDDDDDDAGADAEDGGGQALVLVLDALRVVASTEAPGADRLFEPIASASALRRLRALLRDESGRGAGRSAASAEAALRCLGACASRKGAGAAPGGPAEGGKARGGAWPEVDEGFASDLARILIFGAASARTSAAARAGAAAAALLGQLLSSPMHASIASKLGDLRPLRKAVAASVVSAGSGASSFYAVQEQLEEVHCCEHCGRAPGEGAKLMLCTACRAAEYCSQDCQRRDWKSHKVACKSAGK